MSRQAPTHRDERVTPIAPQPATHQSDVVVAPQRHVAPLVQRTGCDPSILTSRDVLHLQRTVGNQAVCRLLTGTRQPHAETNAGTGTAAIQRDMETHEESNKTQPALTKLLTQRKWADNLSNVPAILQRRVVTDLNEIETYLKAPKGNWKDRVEVVQQIIARHVRALPDRDKGLLTKHLEQKGLNHAKDINSYDGYKKAASDLWRIAREIGFWEAKSLHPGDIENTPPEEGVQRSGLQAAVEMAINTMKDIVEGKVDTAIDAVFGNSFLSVRRKRVKTVFRNAFQALEGLLKENKIYIDKRGDFPIKHVGALTGPNGMTLPATFAETNINRETVLKIIHESTHAVGNGEIKDFIYRGNAQFSKCPSEKKLLNAPHFEAVAAAVLGLGMESDTQVPTSPSGGRISDKATQQLGAIHSKVEEFFTLSWVVTLWRLENLEVLRKQQQGQSLDGKPMPVDMVKQWLLDLSPLYGMALHEQNAQHPTTAFPVVTHVDMAIAEEISLDMGDLIRFMKAGPIKVIPKDSDEVPMDRPWVPQDMVAGGVEEKEVQEHIEAQAFNTIKSLRGPTATKKIAEMVYDMHPYKKDRG